MQRRVAGISLVFLGLFGTGEDLFANVIHVPADQPTIQAAINAAVNGDTVQVSPGTYVENIDFLGKAITVAGDQTTLGAQTTIIDGNHIGPVVTFASGEGPQSVLTGFTIRNGSAHVSPVYDGGGIRISNSSPTVVLNIVTNNDAVSEGGGISSSFGSPFLHDNLVTNNRETPGYSGGFGMGVTIGGASAARLVHNVISGNTGNGLALFAAGTPLIEGNTISGNSAYNQGGGIWIVNDSNALIVNNLIVGNNAPQGGGIYWGVPYGSRGPYLINNTFAGNTGTSGSALYAQGYQAQALIVNNILVSDTASTALYCDGTYSSTPPTISSNDVFSTAGASYTYSGICAGMNGTSSNISADPMFVGNGDYTLAAGSPAIDTGSSNQAPSTDLNGNPRPVDGNGDGTAAFDMGAFEARGSTVTTLTSSANPAGTGQSITFTASITPTVATGTVQFFDGTTLLGTAPVTNGSAGFTTTLASGTHSLTAVYSGSASFVGSTSYVLNQLVRTSTSTTLTSSATQTTYGQLVTLTANVTPAGAAGTVQFWDGASSLGTFTLSGGSAQRIVSLPAGNHALQAIYGGSPTFDPSTSPLVNLTVMKATPVMSLGSSPNPAVWGQNAFLIASISPGSTTGSVQFFDGGQVLGSANASNGTATLATTFVTVGTHSITANYSGDLNYNPLTSTLSLSVTPAPTSTALTSSANPSVRNKAVTFTATVFPAPSTGSVSFFDGTTLLGTTNVGVDKATFTTSVLAVGTHSIKATYNGSTNYAISTSPVLSQVVDKH